MIARVSLEELRARVETRRIPVVVHSGKVTGGCVFVILPAPVPRDRMDEVPGGERYLAEALNGPNGARPGTIVCSPRHLPLLEALCPDCEALVTENVRAALGLLAQSLHGTDPRHPRVVGITGTNGKTTECYLLEALFQALGRKTGVIGTVNCRWPGHEEEASLTTPGCLTLHAMLESMRLAGVDHAFIEVSSHALDQERVAGIAFSCALMTNLTQDHLDYHRDMEDYFAGKERLFASPAAGGVPLEDKIIVANADDAYCRRILAAAPGGIGFGLARTPVPGSRHLAGRILSLNRQGIRLVMKFEGRSWGLASPLVGVFNAMNLLGAQAVGLGLGLRPEDFAVLSTFPGVAGRLERVPDPFRRNVFVDYAHTPDALIKALSALRDSGFSRIVTVFGCGGNRDRGKRPLMGRAVAGLSDVAVLTSDNPRDEDPEAIIADVLPGLADCPRVIVRPDRRTALAEALTLLGPEDALLVAGKGHEPYQLIKGVKHPFSDQATLRELMQ
jgi:UDP-N-acetylmuramoyl-L-alanyl-D-glutamate--2,6-diaminopimelate ligase